jgi:hypothetical protein
MGAWLAFQAARTREDAGAHERTREDAGGRRRPPGGVGTCATGPHLQRFHRPRLHPNSRPPPIGNRPHSGIAARLQCGYPHFANTQAMVHKLEPLKPPVGKESLAQRSLLAAEGRVDELFWSVMTR